MHGMEDEAQYGFVGGHRVACEKQLYCGTTARERALHCGNDAAGGCSNI